MGTPETPKIRTIEEAETAEKEMVKADTQEQLRLLKLQMEVA